MPLTEIVPIVPAALPTVMVAAVPLAVAGAYRTSNVQVAPPAMTVLQVLLTTEYDPLDELNVNALPPLFPANVTGTVTTAPTATIPNAWLELESDGATIEPVTETASALAALGGVVTTLTESL